MSDPLPYAKLSELDEARAKRVASEEGFLAELLSAAGICSFSPATSEWMLDGILTPLERAISTLEGAGDQEPEAQRALQLLRRYHDAIRLIVYVSAYQQRGVIDELQRQLRIAHAQQYGIAPEKADDLENLLLLLRLANIGKK